MGIYIKVTTSPLAGKKKLRVGDDVIVIRLALYDVVLAYCEV